MRNTSVLRAFTPALFLLAAVRTFAQNPPVATQTKIPLWVDLRDTAQYRPDLMPDAKIILDSVKTSPKLYAPDGAVVQGSVVVQDVPIPDADLRGMTYRTVTILMKSTEKGLFFRFLNIHVTGAPRKVADVKIENDVLLSKANFTINVGLVERMLVLNDINDNIEMIYPLGVGGIDPGLMSEGKNRLLTPLFTGATLERKKVVSSRRSPTYYRGQPFMPITNKRGLTTPVGFHISILSDSEWRNHGGSFLVRGFDSHGCMRLRQKDLSELFTVVMNGANDAIPVDVNFFLYNIGPSESPDPKMGAYTEVHPYPLNNAYYMRVKNMAGPGEDPHPGRDPEEGLVYMEQAPGEPDLTAISTFSADDLQNLKIFKGLTEALPKPKPIAKP